MYPIDFDLTGGETRCWLSDFPPRLRLPEGLELLSFVAFAFPSFLSSSLSPDCELGVSNLILQFCLRQPSRASTHLCALPFRPSPVGLCWHSASPPPGPWPRKRTCCPRAGRIPIGMLIAFFRCTYPSHRCTTTSTTHTSPPFYHHAHPALWNPIDPPPCPSPSRGHLGYFPFGEL
jgi:hypothetical protein